MARGEGLDSADRRLLAVLAADGRAKLSALAEATGMSVSTVQARVRRLEDAGVITGYRAVVDPVAVGRPMSAFVEIYAEPEEDEQVPGILEGIEDVTACWSVAGEATHLVTLSVADAQALDHVLSRIRAALRTRTRTTMVLRIHFERSVTTMTPES
ncbi:Lrp/AsnC family transcriptional regulator [Acidipropionibacterium virtanenii]|uniref:DNA-binding transcriptional activator DecR n=1 Tax=Acidipropionibacterium virtanenii TaxID=2057246 RepID=A0A344URD2_9ACTN|nr:Lrp/AsnC family transcriptional regulator [Acidipropionibacterium virtanenii]AXE37830.1 DNA-binding transcriptional activator DecR [Acidipropionibacterium virtanenii]